MAAMHSRTFRAGVVFLLAAGLCGSVWAQASLRSVKGSVLVQRRGSSKWVAGKNGLKLGAGDKVRTKANSTCIIHFGNSSVRLSPYSNFVVQSASSKSAGGKITAGKSYNKLKKGSEGSLLIISTPSAIAGVRSTFFSSEVSSLGASQFGCFSGTVEITAGGRTVTCTPDPTTGQPQFVEVEPGRPPSDPRPAPDELTREAEQIEGEVEDPFLEIEIEGPEQEEEVEEEEEKETVCHIPPENPENAQTLEVDQSAVQAHLDHGDTLGTCEERTIREELPEEMKDQLNQIRRDVEGALKGVSEQAGPAFEEAANRAVEAAEAKNGEVAQAVGQFTGDGTVTAEEAEQIRQLLDGTVVETSQILNQGADEIAKAAQESRDQVAQVTAKTREDVDEALERLAPGAPPGAVAGFLDEVDLLARDAVAAIEQLAQQAYQRLNQKRQELEAGLDQLRASAMPEAPTPTGLTEEEKAAIENVAQKARADIEQIAEELRGMVAGTVDRSGNEASEALGTLENRLREANADGSVSPSEREGLLTVADQLKSQINQAVDQGMAAAGDAVSEARGQIKQIAEAAINEIKGLLPPDLPPAPIASLQDLVQFAENMATALSQAEQDAKLQLDQRRKELFAQMDQQLAQVGALVPPPAATLIVSEPPDSFVTSNESIAVRGRTAPGSRVTVNGQPAAVAADGGFEATVALRAGDNVIEVKSVTPTGEERAERRTVRRQAVTDTTPIQVTVTSPVPNSVFNRPTQTISGLVQPANVTVMVGGQSATVDSAGNFSATVTLIEGLNSLTIVARTNDGRTGQIALPLVLDTMPPLISVQSPRDGVVTYEPTATVIGITEAEVQLNVQGNNVTVGADGSFQVPIVLIPGDNQISLKATDRAGNVAQIVRKVKYDPVKPFLTISFPPENFVTHEPKIEVSGVTKAESIVRVNQKQIFVDPAGAFKEVVPLKEGKNRILIEAVAPNGDKLQATRTVTYTDIPPPPPSQ